MPLTLLNLIAMLTVELTGAFTGLTSTVRLGPIGTGVLVGGTVVGVHVGVGGTVVAVNVALGITGVLVAVGVIGVTLGVMGVEVAPVGG